MSHEVSITGGFFASTVGQPVSRLSLWDNVAQRRISVTAVNPL